MTNFNEKSIVWMELDDVVAMMEAEKLADYLMHNYEEYANELYFQLSMQMLIKDKDEEV